MQPAGEVLRADAQRSNREATALIGMIAFLASWAMLFSGLFFAWGLARVRAEAWPPSSVPAPPLGLPIVNTFVLAASSAALVVGLARLRRGATATLAPALWIAAALAIAFVALQLALWNEMWSAGLRPSSGQYGSLFYMLTWVHAAHVGIGIVALLWLAVRASAGAYSPGRHTAVRMWSLYWHFVGVAWAFLFVMVFLL
jgi:cytochrome c oxidase subunit 3